MLVTLHSPRRTVRGRIGAAEAGAVAGGGAGGGAGAGAGAGVGTCFPHPLHTRQWSDTESHIKLSY